MPSWPQVLGFFVYNFLAYFIFEPVALTCFNHTLELLKKDPRITVRLGNNITGVLIGVTMHCWTNRCTQQTGCSCTAVHDVSRGGGGMLLAAWLLHKHTGPGQPLLWLALVIAL